MSSKRVIGSAEILGNLAIGGKNAMRTFNGKSPDANTGIVDYPIYKREEVQKILDMIPISRIGEMDYLPLNVNGSYQGATPMSDNKVVQPTIIEDDGTAVVLRSGTNGSTEGYYYSFIREIRNITTLTQSDVISTTTMYKPSILPSTENIKYFIGSNGYEFLLSLSTANNYIFTITNSTFNEVSHTHASVASTVFGTDAPIYAHIVGSKVYVWCKDTTVTNFGLALSLYTVDMASVRNGTMSTLAKVTGLAGQTIRSTNYTASNNLRVFDKLYNIGSSTDALFDLTAPLTRVEYSGYTDYNIQANISPDGTRIRVTLFPTHRMVTALAISGVYATGISFVYTISTKTMALDGAARGPATVTYSNGAFNVTNPFQIDMANFTGTPPSTGMLGNSGAICQTQDGLVFASKFRWSSQETYGLQLYKVQGTPYDSWVASTRTATARTNLNVEPVFGSAVGANLLGVRFIDKRKVLLACGGTDDGVNYGYNSTVFSEIGQTPDYTYKSVVSGGDISGFAPQANRKFVTDDPDYIGMISLIEADGSVKSYGTSFIEGVTKAYGGLLNPDTLEFDTSYTIGSSVLTTLKAAIIQSSGLSGVDAGRVVLYYVPDATFSKSMAVVSTFNPTTNAGYYIFAEVNVALTGTNITGATVVTTRYDTVGSVSAVVTDTLMKRYTGLTIAKYSGFTYMGIDAMHNLSQPGNINVRIMIAKLKNAAISTNRFLTSSYIDNGDVYQHGAIPGVGFGYYKLSDSDYQTKAVFSSFGTTEAQMDGLIASTGSVVQQYVVLSQDVAEGFSVYFTREVPVFLGGMFDRLPVQSVELSTIQANPANSTFYLYVVMNRTSGEASYVISTTLIDESVTQTYIGKIVTGATSITSIETEKVTRFLTYRPSTTKRGSAIPASTGVPSGTGTRWH